MITERISHILPHRRAYQTASLDTALHAADFEGSLRCYDLSHGDLRGELAVSDRLELTLAAGRSLSSLCRLLSTSDIDQYKAWIGIPDADIADGSAAPPLQRPSGAPRVDGGWNTASPEALADLDLAAAWYLFGDARDVAAYRAAITAHMAPFEAALYAFSRVEIHPGGTLSVQGHPAVLIFDELVIHPGGSLKLFTPTRAHIRRLIRLPG